MTPVEQHALAVMFDERLRTLIRYHRRWFKMLSPNLQRTFAGLDAEYRVELRSLLALRSAAKRSAKKAAIESWRERHLYGLSASEARGLGVL